MPAVCELTDWDDAESYSAPTPARGQGATLTATAGGPAGDGVLPDRGQKAAFVRAMFDRIADRYDLVNRVMTLGLDRGWRSRTVQLLALAPHSLLADIGCGTGDLLAVAEHAGFQAIGIDLSYSMLRASSGISSPLLHADAASLPLGDQSVDGAVSGFALRNFEDPGEVFAECARVIRPGGRLAILEVDRPSHPLLRLGHSLWFNYVVPRIGAALSDASAYRYLPKSVAYLPGNDELRHDLERAGFCSVEKISLSGGIAQIVVASREATPT